MDIFLSMNIDEMLLSFDPKTVSSEHPPERMALTIWIPAQSKERFDDLQTKTRKKFGKLLAEVIVKSIDKVNLAKVG